VIFINGSRPKVVQLFEHAPPKSGSLGSIPGRVMPKANNGSCSVSNLVFGVDG